MKKLINIIKEMKKNIISLENLINAEHKNLIISKINIKKMESIIEEKELFLRKIASLKKIKLLLEKKYNLFPPYLEHDELNRHWDKIVLRCSSLNKKNKENKIILNQRFNLNQRFLNLFQLYKLNRTNITYGIDGNLDN